MTGKERCRILKDIRKQIAKENEIADITAECTHKGDSSAPVLAVKARCAIWSVSWRSVAYLVKP